LFKCTINKCSAYITVDTNNNVIRTSGVHNHLVKIDEKAKSIIPGMKRKIEEDPSSNTTSVKSRTCYFRKVKEACVVGKLPCLADVRSTLYRTRLETLPVLPKSVEQLQIPTSMAVTINQQQFLIYHMNKNIVVYGSPTGLQTLQQNSHWNTDGTFKTAPMYFSQSYSIHV
ncbi:unnamed protein product, partial [Didymodactylos carnosus]